MNEHLYTPEIQEATRLHALNSISTTVHRGERKQVQAACWRAIRREAALWHDDNDCDIDTAIIACCDAVAQDMASIPLADRPYMRWVRRYEQKWTEANTSGEVPAPMRASGKTRNRPSVDDLFED